MTSVKMFFVPENNDIGSWQPPQYRVDSGPFWRAMFSWIAWKPTSIAAQPGKLPSARLAAPRLRAAEALALAGRVEEAGNCYSQFEKKALAESAQWDNANRELIFYYADYGKKPAESLRIARLELARRRDLYTLDAHAWALYKNGRNEEARKQMEAVLAIGAQDPKILARAELLKR